MTIDHEQFAQESALFPWLDSDCMGDPIKTLFTIIYKLKPNPSDEDFFDDANLFDELEED